MGVGATDGQAENRVDTDDSEQDACQRQKNNAGECENFCLLAQRDGGRGAFAGRRGAKGGGEPIQSGRGLPPPSEAVTGPIVGGKRDPACNAPRFGATGNAPATTLNAAAPRGYSFSKSALPGPSGQPTSIQNTRSRVQPSRKNNEYGSMSATIVPMPVLGS